MLVAKWGNSLAIRIPSTVVEALSLKEGDDVKVRIAEGLTFEIERDDARANAMARIRAMAKPLPPGWTFDRDAANER